MAATVVIARHVVVSMPCLPPRNAWPRAFEGRDHHARSGTKAEMKKDMTLLVMGSPNVKEVIDGRPFEKAHLTVTFYSPRGNFDLDNALSAGKGWIDGLVAAGVIINDTAVRVNYTLLWERDETEATQFAIEERP